MATAKCFRCGATATATTFEQASKQLDHSVGLSRGIKCGDNYNRVQEIKEKQLQTKTDVDKPKIAEPQTDNSESPVTSEKVKEKTKSKKQKYL